MLIIVIKQNEALIEWGEFMLLINIDENLILICWWYFQIKFWTDVIFLCFLVSVPKIFFLNSNDFKIGSMSFQNCKCFALLWQLNESNNLSKISNRSSHSCGPILPSETRKKYFS